ISNNRLPGRGQRIAVLLAGPLAGFLFLGVLAVGLQILDPLLSLYLIEYVKFYLWLPPDMSVPVVRIEAARQRVAEAARRTVFRNLRWGLVNLLPIWPLDGGQISRELFEAFNPRNGLRAALILSTVLAGVVAANSLIKHVNGRPLIPYFFAGGLFAALFFGMLAVGS